MGPPAIAFVAFALLAPSAAAQLQFDELGKRHLPTDDDATSAVALGDVDGDGDLDLILGNTGTQNRLYLNDGTGTFTDATAARMPPDNDTTFAAAVGDVDGDGDLDLVFGSAGQNRLYLNDGTGTFTDATAARMPVDSSSTRAVVLGDVDGDGDPDLVLGNDVWPGEPNRLYLNDGSGTFTDATAGRMPVDNDRTRAVALEDVDGDGDPDLVFGNDLAQQNRLYLNDGTGTFTDATAARLPADNDDTSAVVLGDVDTDGDLDLVVGNRGFSRAQNRLYLNDGSGTFTDATATRLPADNDSTSAVVLGDVDADGDLDLVFGNGSLSMVQQDRLYLNDGGGTFTDATATRMPTEVSRTAVAALDDVDADGDADLVFGSGGPNRLYLNEGRGTFIDATAAHMPVDGDATWALASGDVDGDGDLDLVFGNSGQNRLYVSDGRGTFTNATAARMPADDDYTLAMALGDVDGDGDLDLVFGNGGQNRLYLNDGTGTFTDATTARMPADSDRTQGVALGDVDGDGDLDLVFGNWQQQNRLYLNDGSGTFADGTASRMPVDRYNTQAVALGDVDGDGDPDLVFGIVLSRNRLYLNDGSGTFTDASAARMPADNDWTAAVTLGDVDRDGDPDLVTGNLGAPVLSGIGEQNRLYLNDGAGTFTDATAGRMPTALDRTSALALGDVDGDGDSDLVIANQGLFGERNRLYLNDGNGAFTDATTARMPDHRDGTLSMALGDVDGDGDPDLVFGNGASWMSIVGEDRLYLNLLRQLDSPFLVIPGRGYRLDVYARHGPPRLVDVALPYVSPRTARVPLPPFGTLGLDPALLIPLPPFVVPRPAGVGSVTVTVPNAPALVGLSIHAQALLLQWPGPAFLSNVTSDRIVR